MKFFVTAIGTDSGKTVVSAILAEALKADYWKPVQAGLPKDSDTVRSLLSNTDSKILPERYVLNTPASPHAAAKIDGVTIRLHDFELPDSENLVVEGAGGVLVPLNDEDHIIDLCKLFQIPIVLVSNLYLGSINHSLLTIEYLKAKEVEVKGIVFNGESNPESERIILKKSPWPLLFQLPVLPEVSKATIIEQASKITL